MLCMFTSITHTYSTYPVHSDTSSILHTTFHLAFSSTLLVRNNGSLISTPIKVVQIFSLGLRFRSHATLNISLSLSQLQNWQLLLNFGWFEQVWFIHLYTVVKLYMWKPMVHLIPAPFKNLPSKRLQTKKCPCANEQHDKKAYLLIHINFKIYLGTWKKLPIYFELNCNQ